MLSLPITGLGGDYPKVLLLGAHSDDIEIGVGGSLLRWFEEGWRPDITWVVFSANATRKAEAQKSVEDLRATFGLDTLTLNVYDYRESYFPAEFATLKDMFEDLKSTVSPDIVFTHHRDDRHQDHRTICDLTWNTFRDHLILEYEIPKYDGDLGHPNVFVPLTAEQALAKASWVHNAFPSQKPKHWFGEGTFLAMMRLRGVEAATEYAEAFYARKLCL